MKLSIIIFILLFCLSCNKLLERTYCWQLIDAYGNGIGTVCEKSESDMASDYPSSCSYYKLEGEKYCWLVNGQTFIPNLTEDGLNKIIQCFFTGGTAVKVDCKYCQHFYTRRKQTYKPTNSTTYSEINRQQYCGDTSKTLYHGRQIILKDTPDSLIVVQFSSTSVF